MQRYMCSLYSSGSAAQRGLRLQRTERQPVSRLPGFHRICWETKMGSCKKEKDNITPDEQVVMG